MDETTETQRSSITRRRIISFSIVVSSLVPDRSLLTIGLRVCVKQREKETMAHQNGKARSGHDYSIVFLSERPPASGRQSLTFSSFVSLLFPHHPAESEEFVDPVVVMVAAVIPKEDFEELMAAQKDHVGVLPESSQEAVVAHIEGITSIKLQELPMGARAAIVEALGLFPDDVSQETPFRFRIQTNHLNIKVSSLDVLPYGQTIANVFPNVQDIRIEGNGREAQKFLHESEDFPVHITSFLAAFRKLRNVSFTDCLRVKIVLALQIPVEEGMPFVNTYSQPLDAMIRALCDAYESGELRPEVKLEDIFCPWPRSGDRSDCPLCRRVIETFPFQHLVGIGQDPSCEGEHLPILLFDDMLASFQSNDVDKVLDMGTLYTLGDRPGFKRFMKAMLGL